MFSPNNVNDKDKIILKSKKMGETSNVYPNLNDKAQFGLKKSTKLKTILSQIFVKGNQWVKELVNILLLLTILITP